LTLLLYEKFKPKKKETIEKTFRKINRKTKLHNETHVTIVKGNIIIWETIIESLANLRRARRIFPSQEIR